MTVGYVSPVGVNNVVAPPKPPKQDRFQRELERQKEKELEKAKEKPISDRTLKDHLVIASDVLEPLPPLNVMA